MDASYITPFIRSSQNLFETMLQLPVTIGIPTLQKDPTPTYDISGIISMSGDVYGVVVLSFPTATANRVVSLFTGTQMTREHEDFADAVGELVNMVTGGAKAQFAGKNVSISCPSVVIGSDHVVSNRRDMVSVRIPCECDCGHFAVEVSIRQTSPAAAAAVPEVAQAGK